MCQKHLRFIETTQQFMPVTADQPALRGDDGGKLLLLAFLKTAVFQKPVKGCDGAKDLKHMKTLYIAGSDVNALDIGDGFSNQFLRDPFVKDGKVTVFSLAALATAVKTKIPNA